MNFKICTGFLKQILRCYNGSIRMVTLFYNSHFWTHMYSSPKITSFMSYTHYSNARRFRKHKYSTDNQISVKSL